MFKLIWTAIFAGLLAMSSAAAEVPARIVLPTDVQPEHYDLAVVPDAAHLAFSGRVAIDILVARPTRTIELNAADLVFRHVALTGVAGTPAVSFDPAQETATLTFAGPVAAGPHILTIDYTGKINGNAAGFFALDYDTPHGKARALFTQFENSDARRFLPCWDEPARKATFSLTATVPAAEMAVSNMPVAQSEKLADGLARVQFATSPKMSSYLLFFALGDFQRISRKVNGVDVGVVFKRGDAEKAQYALDAATQILPYYESYFDYKYPLPKLDLIAGPGVSQFFGAMENWGAIFFFDEDLLIDPRISTEADRRDVYITIAHEMAHQWFGDLVTMQWWDGIWLNEGFASWMEDKATDHFHPEWQVWLSSLGAKEAAMQVDAKEGTHPIITPIRDVLQANEAFDTITYEKGMSVIRMLEAYVGADTFRAGVRAYIKAHAYGNTVTDELWSAIDRVSPRPVAQVAHAFTLQAGVPLIAAKADGARIDVTQARFAEDASGDRPTSWPVPVRLAQPGGQSWQGLVARETPATVTLAGPGAVVVNAGQTAYFRSLYGPSLFARVDAVFAELAPADQLGLYYDSNALGEAGYAPLGNFLALARDAAPNFDPIVLASLARQIAGLGTLYRGLPGEAAYDAFGRRVLSPILARVGWTAAPHENQNVTILRARLLTALSALNDPAVIKEAKNRFETYVANPSSLRPEMRRSVLAIVARHADAHLWDQLHTLAMHAPSALEQEELYDDLAGAEDETLAQRALALAASSEPPLTLRPDMIRVVSFLHPDMAIDFAAQHWADIVPALEPDSRMRYVPELADPSNGVATIAKLKAFAAAHIPLTAQGDVNKAEAAISFHAKVRAKALPEADRWLAAHGG